MSFMSIMWLVAIVCYIVYMLYHDYQLKRTDEYQEAIKKKIKPKKKLLIKRWWSWVIIIMLLILSLGANDDYNDESDSSNTAKTEATNKPHKQNTQQAKREKMLKVLNMWSSKNNKYGTVKIDKDNNPILILNDETATTSTKSELKSIAIQFGNKVRRQKKLTKAKVGNPAIYDKDDTPIAVWNGSSLELTDK